MRGNLGRLFGLFFIFLALSGEASGDSPKQVRVLLGHLGQSAVIEGEGLKIQSPRRKYSRPGSKIELTARNGRLWYKGKELGSWAKITGKDAVTVNGGAYPGMIRIEKNADKFLVINYLGLEDYLQGVVKNEMSSKWPMEALKAQTVLARTYALKKIEQPRSEKYDLVATVEDQVYSGAAAQDPSTAQAIEATRGEVLYYNGVLAEVFYHSCCGGRTEAAEFVWNGHGTTYLQPVKCESCQECPYYFWRFPETGVISPEELAAKLGYQGESVEEVAVSELSPSLRALKLKVRFKGGYTTEIAGGDFRLRLGREGVRSNFFKVQNARDGFVFYGSGSGHGVGLCQWGARGLAEQGESYREILKYYFPGTEVKKIY